MLLYHLNCFAVFLFAALGVSAAYIESLAATRLGPLPDNFKGQVAFACDKNNQNYPAMILTPSGWRQDDSEKSCPSSPDDIRAYCRKVYPSLNVLNVEPATDDVEISNWCPIGIKKCVNNKKRVTPQLCLNMPFESPALLVGKHCKFLHKTAENPKLAQNCFRQQHWESVADLECQLLTQKMNMKSKSKQVFTRNKVGLLLPCNFIAGAAYFAGVEFTCCPEKLVGTDEKADRDSTVPVMKDAFLDIKAGGAESKTADGDNNKYQEYLQVPVDARHSEHERYQGAKEALHHLQMLREQALTKELRETEENLLKMMSKDPKAAYELLSSVEGKFRDTFRSVDSEERQEVLQLDSVHQQRVETHFRHRLEAIRENLQQAVQHRDKPAALHILERLVRLCVREITRVANRAERVHQHVSSRSLETIKEHERAVKASILSATAALDVRQLLGLQAIEELLTKYDDIIRQAQNKLSHLRAPAHITEADTADRFKRLLDKYHTQNIQVFNDFMKEARPLPKLSQLPGGHEMAVEMGPGHHRVAMEEPHLAYGKPNAVVLAALILISVLILLAMVFVLFRQRSLCAFRASKPGYQLTLVDDVKEKKGGESLADKHLQAMMLNGYENPTYKFYEQ